MSAAAVREARDAWRRALEARDGALRDARAPKDRVAAALAEEEEAFAAYIAEAERDDEEGQR